jgi:hypothetical protein
MLKKNLSILAIILSFIFINIFFIPHNTENKVLKVISPIDFVLDNGTFSLSGLQTFDAKFTENNLELSKKLNILSK